jgi:8-oxo-dGTP diphosphatase
MPESIQICTTALCHDGRGRFIMLKRGWGCRNEHGRWGIVAGNLDFMAAAEENITREIAEELGTRPLHVHFLGYRDLFDVSGADSPHCVALDFIAHVDPDRVRNAEPHKHDETGWFTLVTLPPESELLSQFGLYLKSYSHLIASRVYCA